MASSPRTARSPGPSGAASHGRGEAQRESGVYVFVYIGELDEVLTLKHYSKPK